MVEITKMKKFLEENRNILNLMVAKDRLLREDKKMFELMKGEEYDKIGISVYPLASLRKILLELLQQSEQQTSGGVFDAEETSVEKFEEIELLTDLLENFYFNKNSDLFFLPKKVKRQENYNVLGAFLQIKLPELAISESQDKDYYQNQVEKQLMLLYQQQVDFFTNHKNITQEKEQKLVEFYNYNEKNPKGLTCQSESNKRMISQSLDYVREKLKKSISFFLCDSKIISEKPTNKGLPDRQVLVLKVYLLKIFSKEVSKKNYSIDFNNTPVYIFLPFEKTHMGKDLSSEEIEKS